VIADALRISGLRRLIQPAAIIIAAFALGIIAAPAEERAGPPAAGCMAVAVRLVKTTGAVLDRWAPSGYRVFFKTPEMLFDCDPDYPANQGLQMSWDGADFPSDRWFSQVAVASTVVTRSDKKSAETSVRSCFRSALESETRIASANLPNKVIALCSGLWRANGSEVVRIYKDED
jgi:hypothetical protein